MRQQVGSDSGDDPEPKRSRRGAALAADERQQRFGLLENRPSPLDELATERGEPHRFAEAVEQRAAAELFELADLLAEAGLGDVAALGGAAEMAGFGQRDRVLHLSERNHRRRLSP